MSLPINEQALQLLKHAKRPVIVLPHECGVDGFASAYALARVFKSMETEVDIVAPDPAPKSLDFLAYPERVRASFGQLRKFVVSVDVSKAPLEELSYSVEAGELSIFLTPRDGFWSESDIKTRTSTYRYDLIITIGAHSLEAIGDLYTKNSEFFYEVPTLNIDHSPENEHYGQVDILDLTATSNAEVLMQLFGKWGGDYIDEETATYLLSGMIAKTQSFKTSNVTPKTLRHASALLRQGARREEIVDNLFRTRSVETLRLWGRALARLKQDKESKIVWSMLSQQDFMHAGAHDEDLGDVIDELIHNSPDAKVVVLFYEDKERHVCGLVSTDRGLDSIQLALPFKPVGTRNMARVCFKNKTIVETEKEIIPIIKERIKQQLHG